MPEEPLGMNPFAQGTPAHQGWAEMNLKAKEQLALFHAEMLESMPPEDAPAKEFLDFSLMVVAGTFDILARAFSSDAGLSDQAAAIYEEYLIEIGKAVETNANKSRIPCIPEQLFSSEVTTRLHQRKQYWTGHILRTVRERKEASSANVAPKERAGKSTSDPQEAASLEPLQAATDSAKTAASLDPRRGPRPDYETAKRVAEIVARVAGEGKWRHKLDDICLELDEDDVPHPKTWKARSFRGWLDSLSERHLAEMAITHHLKIAARRKITVS
jgi:hypothetical protein